MTKTLRAVVGIALLEVVIALVVLSALVKFAMMKLVTPATMTLPAQVQSVADLIRRAQGLAVVRGQRMSVSVATSGANGRVAIACASGAMPCNTDAGLTLSQGVVVASAATLYFNTLGKPVDSTGTPLATDTSYTFSYQTGSNTATYTVTVSPLTGRVSISP
jgi:hypothetical protein